MERDTANRRREAKATKPLTPEEKEHFDRVAAERKARQTKGPKREPYPSRSERRR